ncbi:MAG TPA: AzlD domain-containing protein [Bacillota bacterium]|jgi:branched-subunit amino acid transport protein|nr:AzlD domain-containing protein [Bacillota bacterium]HOL11055.1 AzlD domain-containing protein [Bacillota bacterium]HPO98863.1 AzlD domain-containing protein [Bacillota bacterium]
MTYTLTAVLLMALVTYIPRVLPISIFRSEIKSKYIKSFLQYVPYAVLGALTFPEIINSTGNFKTALFGTAVALALANMGKSLVIVALGAILTVLITGMFL